MHTRKLYNITTTYNIKSHHLCCHSSSSRENRFIRGSGRETLEDVYKTALYSCRAALRQEAVAKEL